MATAEQNRGPSTPEGVILRPNEAVITREQLTQLIRLNANTANLNRKNYELKFGLNGEKFKPLSYDPVNVVWVQTAPDEKSLFIMDGHHRAGVLDKHWGRIQTAYPDFHPTLRDVTADYLPTPDMHSQAPASFSDVLARTESLVIHAMNEEEPPAITVSEYLKILTEPTMAQSEILSLRVALTLIERWGGVLQNEELAKRYPAMAALAFLQQDRVSRADIDALDEFLGQQDIFFTGDTAEERTTIKGGIHTMATILIDNKTRARTVLESAFVAVGVGDDFLDARDQAETQFKGLLQIPLIAPKLIDPSNQTTPDSRARGLYTHLMYGIPKIELQRR